MVDKAEAPLGRLTRLIIWEIEEYWRFPILELLLSVAVFLSLGHFEGSGTLLPEHSYRQLGMGTSFLFFFQIFSVAIVFSHSIAGSIERGIMKEILSCPVERWRVLFSKFIVNFLMLFAIYVVALYLNLPILSISLLEPMFYAVLIILFLQTMWMCAIALGLSLTVKSEVTSILATVFLFIGIEFIPDSKNYLSFIRRASIIFNYFEQSTRSYIQHQVTFLEFCLAMFSPIAISGIILALSLAYFNYIMQID